jgi:hypothetical protein
MKTSRSSPFSQAEQREAKQSNQDFPHQIAHLMAVKFLLISVMAKESLSFIAQRRTNFRAMLANMRRPVHHTSDSALVRQIDA